ncbi:hypothetical protein HB796_01200 [Listeria welshimeri]|nr:hypothetical protein [Listeria welshimeri]MBC1769053.1 hypothetical protein [Listeria welshimeri]MBC2015215.1 hypothetical protein [Listeria welshimeri]MBC6145618.1 hypothetical protein [Listeria welshimeri]MBC6179405.1 hypothetical protein [Listeria welshimeri]
MKYNKEKIGDDVLERFREIAEELDIYLKEGVNSEKLAKLISQRGSLTDVSYINESLGLWLNGSEQIGKEQEAVLIMMYLDLYVEAMKGSKEETVNALNMFWLGTKEDPELEYMSAYTEYCRKKFELNKRISLIKPNSSFSEKKQFGMEVTNTYAKGVEFIGKIFSTLNILAEVANQNNYNVYKIWRETIYQKIDRFNKITNNKYVLFSQTINRKIRNGEAHLSLSVNIRKAIVEVKIVKKHKTIKEEIPWEDFIKIDFVKIGWMIQAFVYSQILFFQAMEDKENYLTNMEKLTSILSQKNNEGVSKRI